MSDKPEKYLFMDKDGTVWKPEAHLSGDIRYIHEGEHQKLLRRERRQARNEALREAVEVLRNCKVMPPEAAILALMEDEDNE